MPARMPGKPATSLAPPESPTAIRHAPVPIYAPALRFHLWVEDQGRRAFPPEEHRAAFLNGFIAARLRSCAANSKASALAWASSTTSSKRMAARSASAGPSGKAVASASNYPLAGACTSHVTRRLGLSRRNRLLN